MKNIISARYGVAAQSVQWSVSQPLPLSARQAVQEQLRPAPGPGQHCSLSSDPASSQAERSEWETLRGVAKFVSKYYRDPVRDL